MAALSGLSEIKTIIVNAFSSLLPFWYLKKGMPDRFIIYGHVVSNRDHAVSHRYRYPSLEEFDHFIRWLRKIGYDFVSLSDYLEPDGKKKVLITFDDGFRSIYEDLHPYMRRNHLPYAIFILTDPLERTNFYMESLKPEGSAGTGDDRLFLSVKEVQELKDQGVHIGFHSRSHYRIYETASLEDKELTDQLTIPQEYEYLFSKPISFAYPYMAPANFQIFNGFMANALKYKFFFDTKGFREGVDSHFFRISIDAEKGIRKKHWMKFILKRQLLAAALKKFKHAYFSL